MQGAAAHRQLSLKQSNLPLQLRILALQQLLPPRALLHCICGVLWPQRVCIAVCC